MTKRDTKTITVRAKIEAIDRFVARCRELGRTPNSVLADMIEAPVTAVRLAPKAQAMQPRTRRPAQPSAEKPIGFDAASGEPIFKRGVGPQKGKTK